jgi:YfiH family protein
MLVSDKLEIAKQKNRWSLVEIDGLKLIQSPLLMQYPELTHAFTTRFGGESKAPMDWFNLGRHIDDQNARQDAMKNRARLCAALAIDYWRIVVPGQVHSGTVVSAKNETFAQVDAIATDEAGVPILLHFADCTPIILYDPSKRALAVVHAGWKGTAASIVKNAIAFLRDNYGSQPENIVAAVGPAIGSCCYPTNSDVAQRLAATVSNAEGLIVWAEQPRPDLRAINAMQLLEGGVLKVDVTDICTACQPEMFYSHRQSGGKTGRQGAIACINNILSPRVSVETL